MIAIRSVKYNKEVEQLKTPVLGLVVSKRLTELIFIYLPKLSSGLNRETALSGIWHRSQL